MAVDIEGDRSTACGWVPPPNTFIERMLSEVGATCAPLAVRASALLGLVILYVIPIHFQNFFHPTIMLGAAVQEPSSRGEIAPNPKPSNLGTKQNLTFFIFFYLLYLR